MSNHSSNGSSSPSEEFDLEAELARIEAERVAEQVAIRAEFKKMRRRERDERNLKKKNKASSSTAAPQEAPQEGEEEDALFVPKLYIERDRQEFQRILMRDYFSEKCTFTDKQFRRRFRMNRSVFLRIVHCCTSYDPRFNLRKDCTGKLGFTPIQKVAAIIRWFAYGVAADAMDEYTRLGESTLVDYCEWFCDAVIATLRDEYLRSPNDADLTLLLNQAEARGFPGMLGSIDCMHWTWKNCPKGWAGQYKSGFQKKPSIILEAVAGPDTWLWHSFFGIAGSNNDINVLHKSPVLDDMLNGTAPQFTYYVNGRAYHRGYFLGDGIYPSYTTFVKSITDPATPQQALFKSKHENYRKDVERAFGILQARWHIVAQPARGWDINKLRKVMTTCVIMHNMIVENERHTYRGIETLTHLIDQYDHPIQPDGTPFVPTYERAQLNTDMQYRTNCAEVKNKPKHIRLQQDLIQHVWQKFGPSG